MGRTQEQKEATLQKIRAQYVEAACKMKSITLALKNRDEMMERLEAKLVKLAEVDAKLEEKRLEIKRLYDANLIRHKRNLAFARSVRKKDLRNQNIESASTRRLVKANQTKNRVNLWTLLWYHGLSCEQIGNLFQVTGDVVNVAIQRAYPTLRSPEEQFKQRLKKDHIWFECYHLISDFGVTTRELKKFLSSTTGLKASEKEIKEKILFVKRALLAGAHYDPDSGIYTYKHLDSEFGVSKIQKLLDGQK